MLFLYSDYLIVIHICIFIMMCILSMELSFHNSVVNETSFLLIVVLLENYFKWSEIFNDNTGINRNFCIENYS